MNGQTSSEGDYANEKFDHMCLRDFHTTQVLQRVRELRSLRSQRIIEPESFALLNNLFQQRSSSPNCGQSARSIDANSVNSELEFLSAAGLVSNVLEQSEFRQTLERIISSQPPIHSSRLVPIVPLPPPPPPPINAQTNGAVEIDESLQNIVGVNAEDQIHELEVLIDRHIVTEALHGSLADLLEAHLQDRLGRITANSPTHRTPVSRVVQRTTRTDYSDHRRLNGIESKLNVITELIEKQMAMQNATDAAVEHLSMCIFQRNEQFSSKKVSEGECVVCLQPDSLIDCVLYRCGHMATCYSCGLRLLEKPCPVCRKKVVDVIRVYRAARLL